jgi:hypothetical protein
MLLVHVYDEAENQVFVVAVQDARRASSATSTGK